MSGATGLLYRVIQVERKTEELDGKVDIHDTRIVGLEKDVESHAASTLRMEKKMDSAGSWLRGLVASVLTALILILIDLVFGIRKH